MLNPTLPIDPVLPALTAALARGHGVLTAPTGSGKTTGVPLALLDAPWLGDNGILMLEPRRPAARMAATRMAAVLGEAVGGRVGYQVRHERRVGPRTRCEVVTEGILTRRLQRDPELTGVGLLIFDEFHERSLDADLGLALALDVVANLRPDLRILVMSATLDAAAVAGLLGDAPVISGEGRAHPVMVQHAERPIADPVDAMPATIRRALAEQSGDLLVFLPGAGEIARVAARLGDPGDVAVLPLHGALSLAEQERALRPAPGDGRRVILATDIAETSLTIEGVGVVIDSGLTRKPRFEPGRGLTRLVTMPIALASAEQRAGRAGRLGPGVCIRLWTHAEEQGRAVRRPAEILEADLAGLVLELAVWGVREPAALCWLDAPPAGAWAQGRDLLIALGALDAGGAPTPLGRRMAALPTHPRLARMLLGASGPARGLAADLAALLGERDPWVARPGQPRPADLGERLAALAAWRARRPCGVCDPRRLAAIDRASAQFRRLLGQGEAGAGGADEPGALLALAWPDRVARNRGGRDGRLLLANGSGAVLPPDDALATAAWLVVADLDAGTGDHRVRGALPISESALRAAFAGAIERRRSLVWDEARGAVCAADEERLGALVLDSRPAPIDAPEQALDLLLGAIARDPTRHLPWTPAARALQARLALARRWEPDGDWPDLGDDWLLEHLADWLGPWLAGKTRLAEVRALDLVAVLNDRLGHARVRRLDGLAPVAIDTPAGTRRPIDYLSGDEPVLALPMQELFGAATTPCIGDGRRPLLVHLLSPAGRPLQVTRDLAGFWRGAYGEVRKEMRGRYPKHHWPEDPAGSAPVRGGLKRHAR